MKKWVVCLTITVVILSVITINGNILNNRTYTYAEDLEIIGEDLGLIIEPSGEKLFDLSNLNPGDRKSAKLTIKNNYEDPFNLYMTAEKVGEIEKIDLFDQLELEITYQEDKIFEGIIKDFATENISLGKIDRGDIEELEAEIHLPGSETGNEFQGKSLEVKWIFTAESKSSGDSTDDDDDDNDDNDNGRKRRKDRNDDTREEEIEEEIIIQEEIPQGVPKNIEKVKAQNVEEIIEIQEEVPQGIPLMPKTGEDIPIVMYSIGIIAILGGVAIGKRK